MFEGVISRLPANGYAEPLVIFVGFLLLAIIANVFFYRLIRLITKKTKSEMDDKIRRRLKFPIFLTIILIGVFYAFKTSGVFPEYLIYIANGVKTLIMLMWLSVVLKIISIVISHYDDLPTKVKMRTINKAMLPFTEKVAKAIVFIITLLIFLNIWSVDISPLLASAGILSLAIAFAAKDTIANIFGGISIYMDKTYGLGDYIVIADKYRGIVLNVGLRTTKIKTRDDIEVIIPNSVMATDVVVNESGGYKGMLRVRLKLGIMYGENIRKVEKILLDVAKKAEWVAKEPQSKLRFRKMGVSALECEFLFWVKEPEWRGRALSEMNTLVYERFNKEKIKFGYVPEYHIKLKKN